MFNAIKNLVTVAVIGVAVLTVAVVTGSLLAALVVGGVGMYAAGFGA